MLLATLSHVTMVKQEAGTLQPAVAARVDLARARARDYLQLRYATGHNHSARWELQIEESFQVRRPPSPSHRLSPTLVIH